MALKHLKKGPKNWATVKLRLTLPLKNIGLQHVRLLDAKSEI